MLAVLLLLPLLLTGCGALGDLLGGGRGAVDDARIAVGVSDRNGVARVESAAGVIDFQVSSGLTGERLLGVRIRVAVWGTTRLMVAEDPTGAHLPVAIPLAGEATVRRLVMPPRVDIGYNIASAAGPLNLGDLTLIDVLDENRIRQRLLSGPNEAVLIYLYNPARPLALTGAPLEAYRTPFENVTVLRAAGEPADAVLALLPVAIAHSAYDSWSNRPVDRYLAGRIGQAPDTDLRSDLAFRWAYPVYDVFPADGDITLDEQGTALLRVSWRSRNPDPPPPWSFFVTSDSERVTVEPEAFALGPESPPAEIRVMVDRSGLGEGDYSATIFIQPFSDAFGMIEQSIARTLTFVVAEALPTATPAPSVESLIIEPAEPRQGDRMIVLASGLIPNEPVLFELIGVGRTIRDSLAAADAGGGFRYEVDLATVPAGTYTLRITGSESALVGEQQVIVADRIADGIVAADELNLRLAPSYDQPVREVLVRGDELTAISTNYDNSWIEVETRTGLRGWVVASLVDWNVNLVDVPYNTIYAIPPSD